MVKAKELMKKIRGKTIGLDAMVFIYHFDQRKPYYPLCLQMFRLLEKGKAQAITSAISLAESLSHPPLESQPARLRDMRDFFLKEPNLKVIDANLPICEEAAFLRRKYNIRLPDALEIATALKFNSDCFLTNDDTLRKIAEIPVLLLKDFVK